MIYKRGMHSVLICRIQEKLYILKKMKKHAINLNDKFKDKKRVKACRKRIFAGILVEITKLKAHFFSF